jgi:hypothetical protein
LNGHWPFAPLLWTLDELASERAGLLDRESAELEQQAERLAAEIKELNGDATGRIG